MRENEIMEEKERNIEIVGQREERGLVREKEREGRESKRGGRKKGSLITEF